jgi:hypothetical protein
VETTRRVWKLKTWLNRFVFTDKVFFPMTAKTNTVQANSSEWETGIVVAYFGVHGNGFIMPLAPRGEVGVRNVFFHREEVGKADKLQIMLGRVVLYRRLNFFAERAAEVHLAPGEPRLPTKRSVAIFMVSGVPALVPLEDVCAPFLRAVSRFLPQLVSSHRQHHERCATGVRATPNWVVSVLKGQDIDTGLQVWCGLQSP